MSWRKRRSLFLRKVLASAVLALILCAAFRSGALSPVAAHAAEAVWTYRRLDPLYIDVPDSWQEYSERNARGFYTGKPPSGGVSVGSLVVLAGVEKTARYEDVLDSLKRSPGGVLESLFQQEEGIIGGRNAVIFSNIIGRRGRDGHSRPFVRMRGVVWKEAADGGILLLVTGGDAALFEENAAALDRMIASVRFDEPVVAPPEETLPPVDLLDLPPIDLPPIDPSVHEPEQEILVPPSFVADARLEEEIRKMREALRLREEGAILLALGEQENALILFEESLLYVSDPSFVLYVEELKDRIDGDRRPVESPEQILARELRNEGETLENDGRFYEAFQKYEESLNAYAEEALRLHADALEARLKERARALVLEGTALQRDAKFDEAIGKFRESLLLYPRDEVREHIRKLEEFLRK